MNFEVFTFPLAQGELGSLYSWIIANLLTEGNFPNRDMEDNVKDWEKETYKMVYWIKLFYPF